MSGNIDEVTFAPGFEGFRAKQSPRDTKLKARHNPIPFTGFKAKQTPIDEKTLREQRRKAFLQRKRIRDQVLGHPLTQEMGGIIGETLTRNAYSDEAIAGKMLAQLLFTSVEVAFNLHYLEMLHKEGVLSRQELQISQTIIYRWTKESPEIYPLGENNEPDYSADPQDPKDINEYLIWKNGYMPEPRFLMGYEMAAGSFNAFILGKNALDPVNLERLYGDVSEHQRKTQAPDLAAASARRATPAT